MTVQDPHHKPDLQRTLAVLTPSEWEANAQVTAGTTLWNQDDPATEVLMLLKGTLEILGQDAGGEVHLRDVQPGALIGERACFPGEKRTASVRAKTDCEVLRLTGAEFLSILHEKPDLMRGFLQQQIERINSLSSAYVDSHRRSITDALTQLHNFGFFQERLLSELERARAMGEELALVLFDVDHFKQYNDKNGHDAGNVALTQVATLMKECSRRGDLLARYGGEEFAVLLYGATPQEALTFANRVRETVAATEFTGGLTQPLGRVTVSAGIARYPRDGIEPRQLIEAADRELYRAKHSGRNQVSVGVEAVKV